MIERAGNGWISSFLCFSFSHFATDHNYEWVVLCCGKTQTQLLIPTSLNLHYCSLCSPIMCFETRELITQLFSFTCVCYETLQWEERRDCVLLMLYTCCQSQQLIGSIDCKCSSSSHIDVTCGFLKSSFQDQKEPSASTILAVLDSTPNSQLLQKEPKSACSWSEDLCAPLT